MAYTLEDVEKKKKEYDEALGNKPSSFYSEYKSLRDSVLREISERKDFSYNPLSDEVYNLYKDRYAAEGEKAMKNTVAAASSLTGGYANSYAARAGTEAYNDYVRKSSDIIPDLYDLALERYKLKASYKDDLYSYYSDLYENDVEEYEDLWDRYYKDISERESAYKTAKDSYDYDEKVKFEAEESARKAALEAEKLRQAAEEARIKAELEAEKLRITEEEYKRKAELEAKKLLQAEVEAEMKRQAAATAERQKKEEEEAMKKTQSVIDKQTEETVKNMSSTSSSDNKTTSDKSDNAVKRETEAIKSFRSSLLSKTDFKRSPASRMYSNYNDYVRMSAQSWFKEGRITEGELSYIKDMYVLR